MASHSSILGWKIPWTEEPGGIQSMGLQRVKHNLTTEQQKQLSLSRFKRYWSVLVHEFGAGTEYLQF